MSYFSKRIHEERNQAALQGINSERIEAKLRGQLTPSRDGVIRALNERRKRMEEKYRWEDLEEVLMVSETLPEDMELDAETFRTIKEEDNVRRHE